MITAENLSYQYPGAHPIHFPDLQVAAGEALLICGESGCGKTTLLHVLAGLRKPSSGQVEVGPQKISDLSAAELDQFRGQHIGMVFQQAYFVQSLSVLDNLLLSPYANDRQKAEAIAERLYIDHLLSRYPHQLSVGQQQRTTIARAVINEPKLILADEPTSALDNKNCAQVIDLLQEEAQRNQAALIIVTHDDRLRAAVDSFIELEPHH